MKKNGERLALRTVRAGSRGCVERQRVHCVEQPAIRVNTAPDQLQGLVCERDILVVVRDNSQAVCGCCKKSSRGRVREGVDGIVEGVEERSVPTLHHLQIIDQSRGVVTNV